MTGLAPQTLLRVNEVYELLLAGVRKRAIVRHMNERHGVKDRAVEKYIALAREMLESDAAVRRQAELGKTLNRLETLFAKSMAAGDLRGARQVEETRIGLLGLAAPETHVVSGEGGGPIQHEHHVYDFSHLSDEELQHELQATIGSGDPGEAAGSTGGATQAGEA